MRVRSLLTVTALVLASCGGSADETAEVEGTPAESQVAEPISTVSPAATTVPTVVSTSKTVTTVAPSTTVSSTTTTLATTTTSTLPPLASLAAGLFCRDLAAMGYDYTAAVSYWTSEGSPDRMDADHNGIPCETVYPHSAVAALWGDPLPTTTVAGPTAWYGVGQPEYQVVALPGSGGMYGSGCSPGSDTLPDGIWFGAWASIANTTAQFDLMCIGPGLEDHDDVTNSSTRLRPVTIDPNALVYRMGDDGAHWDLVPYGEWLTLPISRPCGGTHCQIWLYVNDGRVTEIVELWFP